MERVSDLTKVNVWNGLHLHPLKLFSWKRTDREFEVDWWVISGWWTGERQGSPPQKSARSSIWFTGWQEWESWSKWDWRLRRKNRINAKVIGPVDTTGILGTGVSGVWKNKRNPVWPGARPLVPKRWSALIRKENLRVCIGGEGNKRMRIHEKKDS